MKNCGRYVELLNYKNQFPAPIFFFTTTEYLPPESVEPALEGEGGT